MARGRFSTGEITAALHFLHPGDRYAFLPELRVGTGWGPIKDQPGSPVLSAESRIDAWAIDLWPSSGMQRTAYEIKRSRADFRREIADPGKRREALALSNRFYFAAPQGIIPRDELPADCGLVELSREEGSVRAQLVVEAPCREQPAVVSWRFAAMLARRGTKAAAADPKALGTVELALEDARREIRWQKRQVQQAVAQQNAHWQRIEALSEQLLLASGWRPEHGNAGADWFWTNDLDERLSRFEILNDRFGIDLFARPDDPPADESIAD